MQMQRQTGRNYTNKHTDANTDKNTDANHREAKTTPTNFKKGDVKLGDGSLGQNFVVDDVSGGRCVCVYVYKEIAVS